MPAISISIASLAATVVSLLLLPLGSMASERPRAVTDPREADEDFAIQGEYSGQIEIRGEKKKVALQVWAKGGGEFEVSAYEDGLPGDGGKRSTGKNGVGKRDGAVTVVRDPDQKGGEARIRDGRATFADPGEKISGTLERVERKSKTLGAKPPDGAIVLFEKGKSNDFEGGKVTEDGVLTPLAPGNGCESKRKVQSCTLHVEFQVPYMPRVRAGSQDRGNSGVYLQGRYEVQVLDSFGLEPAHDGCGGIYTVAPPEINMSFPPLSWQTYDIDFTAAQFDATGKKVRNARLTVQHNGVLVHKDREVDHATTASIHPEGAEPQGIYLQNHGSPVRYRNVWIVERE